MADPRQVLVAGFLAALIAGCAVPPRPVAVPAAVSTTRGPADFPARYYEAANARGAPVFRIDPALSRMVIEVRRAGSFAQLGHDHVVASHDLRGYVAPSESRADFYVPLAELVVDEPRLRAEAGFTTTPSAADIAGTRRNMLVRVLDVDRYPFAVVSVRGITADLSGSRTGAAADSTAGTTNDVTAEVAITLKGVTRTLRVPVRLRSTAEVIDATGSLAFAQSDFGIVPLSILGGAIEVRDRLVLRFDVVAGRAAGTGLKIPADAAH